MTTVVYKMPFLRRLYCKLMGIFFDVNKFYIWSKDVANRLAIKKLQEIGGEFDYYINHKINIMRHSGGYYIAEASATGLKLYKDTLGLFQIPSDVFKFKPKLKRMHLVRNLFRNILVFGAILVLMIFSFHVWANKIISGFTLEDEQQMWVTMSGAGVIKNRYEGFGIQESEEKINSVLKRINFSDSLSQYNFEVLIIDDLEPDLHLLPAGKIVLTKGLIKEISSEQELMFIVLDAVGHYENKSHLKVLGQKIITPHFVRKIFGDESFISTFAFNFAGFYTQSYPSDAELESNNFALVQLDRFYNDIGSIGIFAENIIHEDTNYIKTHPITVEHLEMLKKASNLDEGDLIPLELTLDEPAISIVTNKISEQKSPEAFDTVEEELNEVYTHYNDAIRPLLDVLDPRGMSTNEGISDKLELVEYGIDVVEHFEHKFAAKQAEMKVFIDDYFAKAEDQDQARFDKVSLYEALEEFEDIIHFYFKRDLQIFKLQKNILRFVRERAGTYKIEKGRVVFNSSYEQENFNKLILRIEDLVRQKPKFKTDKWRNYG